MNVKSKFHSGMFTCVLWSLLLIVVVSVHFALVFVWTAPFPSLPEDQLPRLEAAKKTSHWQSKLNTEMVVNLSLTFQCGFFLLVPVYVLLALSFSNCGLFDSKEIEEEEADTWTNCEFVHCLAKNQDDVVNESESTDENKQKTKHKFSREYIERLQTGCDSPSDESFYSQAVEISKPSLTQTILEANSDSNKYISSVHFSNNPSYLG